MKNQMKNLTKTLLASAALSLAAGSAFAQTSTLTVTGNTKAATCALGAYLATAPTVVVTSFALPDISTAALGTTVGPINAANYTKEFLIKPTSSTCISSGTGGTFNASFSATNTDANVPTRAKNNGTATGITVDLVQTASASTGTGLSIPTAPTTGAIQHGLANQPIATGTGLAFTARYYKTLVAASSVGSVTTSFTVNNEYQ